MTKRDPYSLQAIETERIKTTAYLAQFLRDVKPLTEENRAKIQETIRRHDAVVEAYQQLRAAAGLPTEPPERRYG